MTNASEHLTRRRNRHQVGERGRRRRFARPLAVPSLALALFAPAADAQQAPRAADGTITTVAGTTFGYSGDNGPAGQSRLGRPAGLALFSDGSLSIADTANHAIRVVQPNGVIFTDFGGSGPAGDCSDGATQTNAPSDVIPYRDGYLVVAPGVHCIQRLTPTGEVRFAGVASGNSGLSGDGGPARSAQLSNPTAGTVLPDGSVLIADTGNDRIRRIDANGAISTFAGTTEGFGGDGGPATGAQLSAPRDVTAFPDGTVLIADTGNDRVRKVTPTGIISTVAGGAGSGLAGDGDPATTAQLQDPASVLPLANGGFLVADAGNDRVRRVTPLGAIFTAAGTTGGLSGDGALAKNAQLDNPQALVAGPAGGFLVADTDNSRIRAVSDVGAVPGAVLRRSMNLEPNSGAVTVQTVGGPTTPQPLLEPDLVPLGSVVDSRAGQAIVNVQRGTGALEPARAYDGIFQLSQATAGADPITDVSLVGPMACAGDRRLASVSARRKKRPRGKYQRRLWVDSKGKYRIRGRYVSALERGTVWRVRDACDRSEVYVKEGAVRVRDLVRGGTKLVRGPARFVVHAR